MRIEVHERDDKMILYPENSAEIIYLEHIVDLLGRGLSRKPDGSTKFKVHIARQWSVQHIELPLIRE